MNTKTVILTVMQCTATTDDKLQNAKNALEMLENMKANHNSGLIRKAIRKQKKLINSLVLQ